MTTIENQVAAPSATVFKRCRLCDAMDPTKPKFDELRRRILQWEDQVRNHEKHDLDFILRKCFDHYVSMVATSRASIEQQTCEKDRQDIVRYHTMSYESFAEHLSKPHRPTRESRNVQKNDRIETLYTTQLKCMKKYLNAFEREGKDADLETYTALVKSLKSMNDISVSPRYLSFHTVRRSIHK